MLDDLENDYEDVVEAVEELDESIKYFRNLPERNEAQEKMLERDEDMRETLPNSKKPPILSEMGFIDAYVEIHNENRKRQINIVFSPKIEADDNVLLLKSKLENERLFEKAFAQFKNN